VTNKIQKLLIRIKTTIDYFHYAKRSDVLQQKINELIPASKKHHLIQFSPTRWVQRSDALLAFKELFMAVTASLQYFSAQESDSTPEDLLNAFSTKSTIFCLSLACKLAYSIKFLATFLQTESIDIVAALDEIDILKRSLNDYCENEDFFEECYRETMQLSMDYGIEIDFRAYENRTNMSAKEFWRKEIFSPYVESMRDELNVCII
jgi:hypothetical protein